MNIDFLIVTNDGNRILNLSSNSTDEEFCIEFVNDFLSVFDISVNEKGITVHCVLRNTEELRKKIQEFIDKYENGSKTVWQLQTMIKQWIKPDELFCVLPYFEDQKESYLKFNSLIVNLNKGMSFNDAMKDDEYEKFKKTYLSECENFYTADVARDKIGEIDKTKRVCRFCGKISSDVSFKDVAHAIPEALGNKKIINNEECDVCNHKFGDGLDKDLVDYLNFHRSIFNIRGKKGAVEINFKNGCIKFCDGNLNIASKNIELDAEGKPKKIKLTSPRKLSLQNIYKALARISISTLENFDKDKYKFTVDWINGEKSFFDKLPRISVLLSEDPDFKEPVVINYVRKNDDVSVPTLVSELRIKNLFLVYIVPVSEDDFMFCDEEKFNRFWSVFKFYSCRPCWQYWDFSKKEPININYNMNMINIKDLE